MYKHLSLSDKIMLAAALVSLVFAEISWFSGEERTALFVGLWVPTILGFAIYLKLINQQTRKSKTPTK